MKNRTIHLLKVFWMETFRNKISLFFTVFFPLLFIIIFGTLFGEGGAFDNEKDLAKIGVLKIEEDFKEYLKNYEIIFYKDVEKLKKDVENGELKYGIENKENSYYIYLTNDLTNYQNFQNIKSEIDNSLKRYNYQNLKDFFIIEDEVVAVGKKKVTDLGFIITGALAISILSGGMFSVITIFGRYKKENIIKKFMTTPVKPIEFVFSSSFVQIILNFFAVFLNILFSIIIFNTGLEFNWLLLIISVFCASIAMMGFGILLLLIFKKVETAQNASSILYMVMTFFAGVYFPLELIPSSIRWLSYIMPIKYLADTIRFSASIQDMSFAYFWIINITFFVIGILLLQFASNKYVTEE
ncbi:ABC transporter permease [Oceanotoga teriensis]|uniref:ABC transporter permease n=1 Tax=Oceanotoga teriensis TaxID=515440 RepID=UPI002713E141|nr:ABC transporter permease [Oceanotoga teriensis]MDO7975675.1 ABC transporter permease [Oceanotoga teriensis]